MCPRSKFYFGFLVWSFFFFVLFSVLVELCFTFSVFFFGYFSVCTLCSWHGVFTARTLLFFPPPRPLANRSLSTRQPNTLPPPCKWLLVGCSSSFMRLAAYLSALRFVRAMFAWSVKTRRAPPRYSGDARVLQGPAEFGHV